MEKIKTALENLSRRIEDHNHHQAVPFAEFLELLTAKPDLLLRDVFQLFCDMVNTYIGKGTDEYPEDPESVGFLSYDSNRLFVDGTDHPFFADRLFTNRFVSHVASFKSSAQQNKIYIFDGPPGCGKSIFLNNLLMKFEEYANTDEGRRYKVVWRLDSNRFGRFTDNDASQFFGKLTDLLGRSEPFREAFAEQHKIFNKVPQKDLFHEEEGLFHVHADFLEVPCPSHDHPILMIPKRIRRAFLEDLFEGDGFKERLLTEKEYDWVFSDHPCTICSTMYDALLRELGSPKLVFKMLYAQPYRFNRRLGEGISIFNPGDRPMKQNVFTNDMIQQRLNQIFMDSNLVRYIYSTYAKTNNGVYALMDIKSHNTERMIELHNIISEGVHKVQDIEENVNSLFLAVMNPEDKANISDFQSFSDRIQYIKIPYVLDLKTEVEIYRHIFGTHIDDSFLPRVLHNFARVIISTRLEEKADALLEWIGDPGKYDLYCDKKLQLLKMDLYTGYIPPWLTEEDRKGFTAKRRRSILAESEKEGKKGFSGRDSIKMFSKFYSTYAKEDSLINMSMLYNFFTKTKKEWNEMIPDGFLDSLVRMYDYLVLQEVKESLYYYNEEQIARDIQNYMFALNFELGSTEVCTFTGEKLNITEDFLESIESRLLSGQVDRAKRLAFRRDVQKEYTSKTLTQEIVLDGKPVQETNLFESLKERYEYNLKQKVLDPFLENENFRRAILDLDAEDFKTYDQRIKDDVTFLINNLQKKYRYSRQGAKHVCMYVIDNDLAKKFTNP